MSHYVDNQKFLEALKQRKLLVFEAENQGNEKPQVSNYLGECIYKIANHLSYKANFINYSYRDEMVADGIETSLRYIDNFDPEKSSNPFAYFTQIIYFAFLRRLTKEKKQSYIKNKILIENHFDSFELQEHDEDGMYDVTYSDILQTSEDFVEEYESNIQKKKKKKQQKEFQLDEFLEE
jgi:DNA-directed RNA polymerase specialized sigma24 family protein